MQDLADTLSLWAQNLKLVSDRLSGIENSLTSLYGFCFCSLILDVVILVILLRNKNT